MAAAIAAALDGWRGGGRYRLHRGHAVFFRDDAGAVPDGAVLVCLHGFPTSSFDWHRLWPALRSRFARVVACDFMGLGWSDKPRRYAYGIADQADLVEGLLRGLGIARLHLLAHDYGDTVAQELLARHDERGPARPWTLASLCLLNGGLFPETHRALPVQRLLASPVGPLVARLTTRRRFAAALGRTFAAPPPTAELDALWSIVSYQRGHQIADRLVGYMAERRAHRGRWVGALQRTAVPVRVIDGADDPISGAHMVARYRALVPSPDCVELPGVGHYPQLEAPDAVLAAYAAFLDGRAAAGVYRP